MNTILVAKFVDFVVTELGSIVVIKVLRHAKMTNDLIFDKVDHSISFNFG